MVKSSNSSNNSKQQRAPSSSRKSADSAGVGGQEVVLQEQEHHDTDDPKDDATTTSNVDSSSGAATTTTNTAPLCRFYRQGRCCYGDACYFRHDEELPAADGSVAVDQEHQHHQQQQSFLPLCRFYQRGYCRYGGDCMFRHDDNANIDLLKNKQQQQEPEALICGICLEDVSAMMNGRSKNNNKKFGLLSNCPHVFCLDCLMQWRTQKKHKTDDRRGCPTCRTVSQYTVPSAHFAASGPAKDRIVARFKASRAVQPCKNFDGSLGSCPFGKDCFYRHADANGNCTKEKDQGMQELHDARVAARGEQQSRSSLSLEDELLELEFLRYYLNNFVMAGVDNSDDDSDENSLLHWLPMPPSRRPHRAAPRR